MNIFSTLMAGDSAQWDDAAFSDAQGKKYDSAAYTLKYELRGPSVLTLTAVANGSGWRTTLTTTQSDGLLVGTYWWAAVASKAGERFTAASGELTITADLIAATANFDGRTQAEKALDDAKTALATFKSTQGKVKSYTIGTRAMVFESTADILDAVNYWQAIVANEQHARSIANGQGDPRKLFVRFTK